MIKDFIETTKELKNEYLPFLTPRMVFFGILIFFLLLSIFTSTVTSSHLRSQTENTSTKIEYVVLGEKTTINLKETIYIDDEQLSNIKFNSTVDSRCPKGAQCIVAGELTYKMHFNSKEIDEDFVISTATQKKETIGGYSINVIEGEKETIDLVIEKQSR